MKEYRKLGTIHAKLSTVETVIACGCEDAPVTLEEVYYLYEDGEYIGMMTKERFERTHEILA